MLKLVFGNPRSLDDTAIAVTGASGTMGRALTEALQRQGAKVTALTTSPQADFPEPVRVVSWQAGEEGMLRETLKGVDILVINHGVNVHGERTPEAIQRSLDINALSVLALMDVFCATVDSASPRSLETTRPKEIWVNTSEAEVGPAFSPLYELSKRLIGDLITLKRHESPCPIRKIILGPFKSNLNPIGIMSAEWTARMVVAAARRDVYNIIVTINPLTYLAFPVKETTQSLYFWLFSRSP